MMLRISPCLILVLSVLWTSCSEQKTETYTPRFAKEQTAVMEDLSRFKSRHIGKEVGDKPWIAHVNPIDLNQDGLMDIVACDAKLNEVVWIKQFADGRFEEIVIGENMRAPVRVEPSDIDQDGDTDLIISSMSVVFPNNDKIGAIFVIENLGNETFERRLIIEGIERVVDTRAADFDGDGLLDLAVGQFGYDQGEVRWMRQTAPWEFESEILLSLSGTVNVCIDDYDGDGSLDFAAIVSQQWEEIHLFLNDGKGNFRSQVIWGSTNEDYSSSGMSSADVNQDGMPDLVFTNGDGFGPNPEPGPKPWHGVQWLENRGRGFFKFHRIGDLGGAYSPISVDIDEDGDMDIVALSSFNNWNEPKAVSMAWFENDGAQRFSKKILTYTPTHLLTLASARMQGPDSPLTLITGGFHAYPPYIEDKTSRILIWEKPAE